MHFEDGDYILDRISHQTLKRFIHLSVSRPLGHQDHDWIKGGKNVTRPVVITNPTLAGLFLLQIMRKEVG